MSKVYRIAERGREAQINRRRSSAATDRRRSCRVSKARPRRPQAPPSARRHPRRMRSTLGHRFSIARTRECRDRLVPRKLPSLRKLRRAPPTPRPSEKVLHLARSRTTSRETNRPATITQTRLPSLGLLLLTASVDKDKRRRLQAVRLRVPGRGTPPPVERIFPGVACGALITLLTRDQLNRFCAGDAAGASGALSTARRRLFRTAPFLARARARAESPGFQSRLDRAGRIVGDGPRATFRISPRISNVVGATNGVSLLINKYVSSEVLPGGRSRLVYDRVVAVRVASAGHSSILHPPFVGAPPLRFSPLSVPLVCHAALHLSGPRFSMGPVERTGEETRRRRKTNPQRPTRDSRLTEPSAAERLAARHFGLPREVRARERARRAGRGRNGRVELCAHEKDGE